MAELNPAERADHEVVVVGSGPGALQTSYYLSRLGIDHVVVTEDDEPGGMFRRFPIYQRLISWSKPFAPVERSSREYGRYDWNSLVTEEPDERTYTSEFMDGTSYFPRRSEMEASLVAFTARAKISIVYGCRWVSTTRTDEGFTITTDRVEIRCRVAIFAVGMAEPWTPRISGIEDVPHYAEARPAPEYEGRSVFLIGKRNSGFELADGLLPWARQVVLASPRPAKLSVLTRSLVGARARYLQPYEDHVLGGGNVIVDGAIQRVERTTDGYKVEVAGTTRPFTQTFAVDEVIAATGFKVPLRDLPALGVATFMDGRLPAQTPFWESATVHGIYFAGSITQGAAEINKHGVPSSSAAVHGFRYNARVQVRHIAQKHFGIAPDRPELDPKDLVDHLLEEATTAPELWNQKGYLAQVVESSEEGPRLAGTLPLSYFVDSAGPDAAAVTIEIHPDEGIHPTLYVRHDGAVQESELPPATGHDFRTGEHRGLVADAIRKIFHL